MTHRYVRTVTATAAALMVMVSACASGESDDASSGAPIVTAEAATALASGERTVNDSGAPTTAGALSGAGGSPTGAQVSLPSVDAGRKVIRTATLALESDDVGRASARAVAIVEATGGALAKQVLDLDQHPNATLVLKVLPSQLGSTLEQLGQLGKVTKQSAGSDDVTATVVDLESRISSAHVSLERLRSFLAGAKTVAEITQLEAEVTRREGDLDSMRARVRSINAQVDQATITLTIAEPAAVVAVEASSDGLPSVGRALSRGWSAFVTAAQAVAVVVAAAAPFLAVGAVGAAVVLAVRRRRRPPVAAVAAAGAAGETATS